MYKKPQKLQGSELELSNYIEGFDVYNSEFLMRLSDPSLSKERYQITVHEYRPDLIAQDFYGSAEYIGILLAQTKIGLENLKRGVVLELIPKNTIDKIISEL